MTTATYAIVVLSVGASRLAAYGVEEFRHLHL